MQFGKFLMRPDQKPRRSTLELTSQEPHNHNTFLWRQGCPSVPIPPQSTPTSAQDLSYAHPTCVAMFVARMRDMRRMCAASTDRSEHRVPARGSSHPSILHASAPWEHAYEQNAQLKDERVHSVTVTHMFSPDHTMTAVGGTCPPTAFPCSRLRALNIKMDEQ
jgi:hypothetical protein